MSPLLYVLLGVAATLLALFGKRWFLRLRARWHAVSFWVDSDRGRDDAAGTRAAPLRTLGELSRRVEGRVLRGDLRVHLTGAFPEELRLHCEVSEHSVLHVSGEPQGRLDRLQQHLGNVWIRLTWRRGVTRRERAFRHNVPVGGFDVEARGISGAVTFKNLNIGVDES